MKLKTAELDAAALDWAVAKAEGRTLRLDPMGFRKDAPRSTQAGWWIWEDASRQTGEPDPKNGVYLVVGSDYAPSRTWAQGGSIIEREQIELHVIPEIRIPANWADCKDQDTWCANLWPPDEDLIKIAGPTPLTAALRCYVQSKLGDEVDVPDELLDMLTPIASSAD